MAKLKSKKKRAAVSFLVVPDDFSEPLSFKISYRTLKVLIVIGSILVVHIFVGAIFYYRFFAIQKENTQFRLENVRLAKENNRIQLLAEKYQEVETLLHKLKISFGIEAGTAAEQALASSSLASLEDNDKVSRDYEPIPVADTHANKNPGASFQFVSNSASTFHTIFENLPTFLPVDGIVTLGFDEANIHEPLSRDRHLGIDIAARRGSIIKAAGTGRIVFADWTPDLGNMIILYHGDGLFSYYAHNMRLLLRSGEVKKGEPIALLGSSGNTSSGPHLHFEIWRNGFPVDPKEYLFALQTTENGKKGL